MADEQDHSKRRKIEQDVAICPTDLPIGILEHAASFLSAPSRALFAVALANDKNNPQSEGQSSSIVGTDWDTLDFGEIEKDLTARLSDDDISGVLHHIDASNKLKRLRLTNCTNITGVGLEPLRGSANIEQIDLSLTANGESPILDPDPPISCELVVPILDSIIAAEGCALKHLQFPYHWRSPNSELSALIVRYNAMVNNGDTIRCVHCNQHLPDGHEWIVNDGSQFLDGLHNNTCCECMENYCDDCVGDYREERLLQFCKTCHRDYCRGCVTVVRCDICGDLVCECCLKFECKDCDAKNICSTCVTDNTYECSYCGASYCYDCHDDDEVRLRGDELRLCDGCGYTYCNYCQLRMYQEGNIGCFGCIKSLPNEVLAEHLLKMHEEVEELKNEVTELKDVNKELQDEIKELKDKQGN
ncbi:hypothetical protein ACHAWC_003540 [Mediolabrus comicus]